MKGPAKAVSCAAFKEECLEKCSGPKRNARSKKTKCAGGRDIKRSTWKPSPGLPRSTCV